MNRELIIEKTKAYVREKLGGECTGHDWWHAWRVWNVAMRIAGKEGGDTFVIQLAALLHDIGDWKFGGEATGVGIVKAWLESMGVDSETTAHVCGIISGMSFKGAGVKEKMPTLEGKIVQDADRLDAIGAIGIARVFAYGGNMGRPIYEPGIMPARHETFGQYRNSRGTSINHFYEKLLLLKDRMNTKTGKSMAKERHGYMEGFLKRFLREATPS